MKKSIILLLIIFSVGKCLSQANLTSTETIVVTTTTSFFESKTKGNKLLSKYKGKYICPPSSLDTILNENTYKISRVYKNLSFTKNEETHIAFLIETGKSLEWEEFENKNLLNNILVVFCLKNDSTYYLVDYYYKPINQGSWIFSYLDIFAEDNQLKLEQFGGNQFGYWGTEFKFEIESINNSWILKSYSLYTVTPDYGGYIKDKLLWEKFPENKVSINNVVFSEYFIGDELEKIINGVYD